MMGTSLLSLLRRGPLLAIALLLACAGLSRAAPGFTAPQQVVASGASDQHIALQPGGQSAAVGWIADRTARVAVRPAHTGIWDAPTDVSPTGGATTGPVLGFDAAGNLHAVWIAGNVVRAAMRSSAGVWSSSVAISNDEATPSDLTLAVSDNGWAVAAWRRAFNNGQLRAIMKGAARPPGGSWGGIEQISDPLDATAGTAFNLDLAIDAAGNAMAAWTRRPPGGVNPVMQVARRTAAQNFWQSSQDLTTVDPNFRPDLSRIAMNRVGDAAVVWIRENNFGAPFTVEAAYRPISTNVWTGPTTLEPADNGVAEYADVAVGPDGTAVAVWTRFRLSDSLVVARSSLRPPNGPWEGVRDVSSATNNVSETRVVVTGAGDAVAVYHRAQAGSGNIRASVRRAGQAQWQESQDISPPFLGGTFPDIATDTTGDAAFAWTRSGILETAAYDATGPVVSALSIPATATVGVPALFSLAAHDTWSGLGGAPAWSFGDGDVATGASPSHTFAAPGVRSVSASVADVLGNVTQAGGSVAVAQPAPLATTDPAENIGVNGATLVGTVQPRGLPTQVRFEYGLTPAYDAATDLVDLASPTGAQQVRRTIAALQPARTYHYRVVATSASGTTAGADRTFTTTPANPRPSVASVSPATLVAGGPAFILTLEGGGFVPASRVRWQGQERRTTFVSATRVTAEIPASDIVGTGAASVSVVNPGPGGGESNAVNVLVLPDAPAQCAGPKVLSLSSGNEPPGHTLVIGGIGFGDAKGAATVTVRGIAAEVARWSDIEIEAFVPQLAPGPAEVTVVRGATPCPGIVVEVLKALPQSPVLNVIALPSPARAALTLELGLSVDPDSPEALLGGSGANEQAIGLGIRRVLVRFGDRTRRTSTQAQTLSHTYRNPGIYRVSVTAYGASRGESTTRSYRVVVGRPTPPRPVNLSIPSQVVFDFGSAALRPESRRYLERIVRVVRRSSRVRIAGYTDSIGPDDFNLRLSHRRAAAVKAFFVSRGVPRAMLGTVGYGESRPLESNATELGRQKNRRVVLTVVLKRGVSRI